MKLSEPSANLPSVRPEHANRFKSQKRKSSFAVELFCGVGGLTRGMLDTCIPAAQGDEKCLLLQEFARIVRDPNLVSVKNAPALPPSSVVANFLDTLRR